MVANFVRNYSVSPGFSRLSYLGFLTIVVKYTKEILSLGFKTKNRNVKDNYLRRLIFYESNLIRSLMILLCIYFIEQNI